MGIASQASDGQIIGNARDDFRKNTHGCGTG
jgi:hypothetical protein